MIQWLDLTVAGIAVIAVLGILLLRPAKAQRRPRPWLLAGTIASIGLAALNAAAGLYPLTMLFAVASVALGIASLASGVR